MLHKFIGFLLFLIISGFLVYNIFYNYYINYLKIYEKNSYNKWPKFKPFR